MKKIILCCFAALTFGIASCGDGSATGNTTVNNETVAKPKVQVMYDLKTREKIHREVIYAERRARAESGIDGIVKPKKELIAKSDELEERYTNEVYTKYKITHDDFLDVLLEALHNPSQFHNPSAGKLTD